MPTHVQVRFEDGSELVTDLRVHRLEYVDGLNQPFLLTLGITSPNAHVDPKQVLGKHIVVTFEGEPWLHQVRGVVASFGQRTALMGHEGLSTYEAVVRPPLWLLAKRFARRIHQNVNAVDVITATVAGLGGIVPPPVPKVARPLDTSEYTVQYDETDLGFVRRMLAENHLVSFFDATAGGTWTIADDLATAAPLLPIPLSYHPPSALIPKEPHVLALRSHDELGETHVSLRDYNFEHPQLVRASPAGLDGKADAPITLPNERGEREDLRVGRFDSDQDGAAIAKRELDALRAKDLVVTCTLNFAMNAGSQFILTDHPRMDLGKEFVVIGASIRLEEGIEIEGEVKREAGRHYEVTCVPKGRVHFEEPIVRPRVPATEVGFVVGDGPEGTVDVDAYGRVKVELLWDRRDLRKGNPTMWLRVSQAWAGANHGIVTLPRIGDEVLVGYLGGNPDQPIVMGRAHNALNRTPLMLPDPDRTLSIWRSRTIGGDGYNEIFMDDAAGAERLWLRAERDHRLHVKHNSKVEIDGDSEVTVGGNCTVDVGEALTVTSGSFYQSTGPYEVHTTSTLHSARDSMRLESDTITIEGKSKVELKCGGSKITLTPGAITINSGSVSIEGLLVKIKGTAMVDVDGALITLN